jgi:hypothetical protein
MGTATGASRGLWAPVTTVMAEQAVLDSMQGQRHGTVRTLLHSSAGGALQPAGGAASIQEEDALATCCEVLLEGRGQGRRDQVAGIVHPQIDALDRGHRARHGPAGEPEVTQRPNGEPIAYREGALPCTMDNPPTGPEPGRRPRVVVEPFLLLEGGVLLFVTTMSPSPGPARTRRARPRAIFGSQPPARAIVATLRGGWPSAAGHLRGTALESGGQLRSEAISGPGSRTFS